MATHIHKAGDPQSHQQWSRQTRAGKRIHYDLMVIQQPERARACGSGPKSSADRRPVDPPPIVRLTVWEGETMAEAKDVTMDYNSDFFLFVSLENARPMAHGRVQTPAATSPPVLTGVPVSACCYLDRPSPAGYFLFPDLSVRHEGRYKLIFRLYERNKDAQDLNPIDQGDNMEDEDGLFFTFLNEVRSQPFTVFSAKKFPGLAESTPLSRTVAEQGCRVRIRRDVRMRRRENKGAAQTNDYEQREEEYRKDRRTQSPADAYRNRSLSSASDRRASGFDHHPPPPPLAPNQRLLSFAAPTYNKPYQPVPPPAPHSEPVSPAAHTPSYRHSSFASSSAYPPTPTYGHPYADRTASHVVEDRRSSLTYPSMPAQPVSAYGPPLQPRPPMPPIDTGFRRDSVLPPMIKPEMPSPTTSLIPSSSGSSISGTIISSLKRSYEESNDGEYSVDDLKSHLVYKRAGGNGSEKESPGYMGDNPAIDPQLRVDDERDSMKHSRKRSFRSLVDNELH
ncbi:velvet protein [Neopestalotiopsis sp. 37M]|nr:velvet protein [Neopestalotiopsis sp. 37M]